ncbi:MAG: energy transducer TonB [Bacteroidales bacterium]|nr:energy transducer TonB [Bacteroidales bacterium]
MKNHIVLFFSCLLPYLSLSAQDVITLTNGKEIQAIVTEVMQKEIKYKRFDNPNGPVYTLDKSSVSVIKYQNGTKDVINENQSLLKTGQNHIFKGTEEQEIFSVLEHYPEFPGGQEALNQYLFENLIYPKKAREEGKEGTVMVEFIVEADGSITNANVKRSAGEELDKEAVRVVSGMPDWIPGKHRDRAVRVRYVLPVNFRLR